MAMLSSIILQAALLFYVIISAHADEPTAHKICKNEHEDCVAVTYNPGDPSKERVCREACGMTGEELNIKWTVYNCEGHEKECETYNLGANGDFDTSFARHVACVGTRKSSI